MAGEHSGWVGTSVSILVLGETGEQEGKGMMKDEASISLVTCLFVMKSAVITVHLRMCRELEAEF